ncbi:hypothetical protein IFJ82_02910 [Novacetimonas hansenii]|uniref:CBU-0592-like domain-containing protein n=1 Tax=Novacetimonas hansenii TaxID=436 RepID=A0ABQ0SJU1_NOVHA|nr:hypothetical protein [Novacetimonas hansenii]MBL7235951.1 hypothetical protein [Novacetimonas hansenii]QOF95637.1 hypothetical protein IFJ82_02910 [Novacetimonas hansenii]WEQ58520.1 hypothetical protein LV563_11815 [Novacetimonas hansenii]CUW48319.1 hypothetical protein ATCC53582_02456 [Novacetimonas hansenii]GAN83642.1 hypothetical protein Gaha_0092_003 [Novacetimonas hansenii JCM 7643]
MTGMDIAADSIGFVGSIVIVVQYYLSLRGRIDTTGVAYPLGNLCGSLMVMASLCVHFNMPSLCIEAFWSSVSLYGVIAAMWRRMRQ